MRPSVDKPITLADFRSVSVSELNTKKMLVYSTSQKRKIHMQLQLLVYITEVSLFLILKCSLGVIENDFSNNAATRHNVKIIYYLLASEENLAKF